MSEPQLLLIISDLGKAELLHQGKTIWSSDTDPDVVDQLGTDFFSGPLVDDLVEYLEESGRLSWDEAENVLEIETPDGPGDDDDDDDDDYVRVIEEEPV